MTYTTSDFIMLQSAEIFTNAIVTIKNNDGEVLIKDKMLQTNYLTIDSGLPKGEYIIIVEENGKQWKRNILI